jgi:hypothetical protein
MNGHFDDPRTLQILTSAVERLQQVSFLQEARKNLSAARRAGPISRALRISKRTAESLLFKNASVENVRHVFSLRKIYLWNIYLRQALHNPSPERHTTRRTGTIPFQPNRFR